MKYCVGFESRHLAPDALPLTAVRDGPHWKKGELGKLLSLIISLWFSQKVAEVLPHSLFMLRSLGHKETSELPAW